MTMNPIASFYSEDFLQSQGIEFISTEMDAALTIQRAWRRSRAGIDHLKQDACALKEMPHKDFKLHCRKRIVPLLNRSLNPVRRELITKEIEAFFQTRDAWQVEHAYPGIPLPWGQGELPKFKMLSKNAVSLTRQVGHFCLSRKAAKAYDSMEETPLKSKAELDALVRKLNLKTSLLPWRHIRNGCYERAKITLDLLCMSGIPTTTLGLQYALLPERFNAYKWRFHVAVVVTLEDGTSWVVDPALDPSQALSVRDWIKLQKSLPKEEMAITDRGLVRSYASQKARIIFYNPPSCLTFSTDVNDGLLDSDKKVGKATIGRPRIEFEKDLLKLAGFRSQLEKDLLVLKKEPKS